MIQFRLKRKNNFSFSHFTKGAFINTKGKMDKNFEKGMMYHMTIGEIAKKTNLPESTLRYYEKKGLLKVERDENLRRVYREGDVEWIQFIRRLKETGMPLKTIRHYSELRYLGSETIPERLAMLQAHREYVWEQQQKWTEYLQNLEDKIDYYQNAIDNDKHRI